MHAEVFANHDGKKARRRVLQLLDTDRDGAVTTTEKEQASIHYLWTQLGERRRPSGLPGVRREDGGPWYRVQVPGCKPGQEDSTIPDNVKNAVNFYQTRGLIHGRSVIRPADAERTNIIGNFHMTYGHRQINCDNYPWLAESLQQASPQKSRMITRMGQVASFINLELSSELVSCRASSTPH